MGIILKCLISRKYGISCVCVCVCVCSLCVCLCGQFICFKIGLESCQHDHDSSSSLKCLEFVEETISFSRSRPTLLYGHVSYYSTVSLKLYGLGR